MLYDVKKINDSYMDIRTESSKVILLDTNKGLEVASIDAKEKEVRLYINPNDQEKLDIIEFLARYNVIKRSDINELNTIEKIKKLSAMLLMRSFGRYDIKAY